MAKNHCTQRIYRIECRDCPKHRESYRTSDYKTNHRKAEDEGEFESLKEARKFFEEGGVFDFFGGCAPRHIDLEHV